MEHESYGNLAALSWKLQWEIRRVIKSVCVHSVHGRTHVAVSTLMAWCPTGLQWKVLSSDLAPDLFLGPMDHMMECTVHRGLTGVTLGNQVFIDLDFADDVSLLAEMLEVLVLTLTVMQEESSTFGLQINWSKTKTLQVPSSTSSSTVQLADGHVEVVNAFVYLGCMTSVWKLSYASIRHTLYQFWCMGVRPQSTCALVLMHLTCGRYARSWGYRILATY